MFWENLLLCRGHKAQVIASNEGMTRALSSVFKSSWLKWATSTCIRLWNSYSMSCDLLILPGSRKRHEGTLTCIGIKGRRGREKAHTYLKTVSAVFCRSPGLCPSHPPAHSCTCWRRRSDQRCKAHSARCAQPCLRVSQQELYPNTVVQRTQSAVQWGLKRFWMKWSHASSGIATPMMNIEWEWMIMELSFQAW